MDSAVTRIHVSGSDNPAMSQRERTLSPQSQADSAMGGSTSPDDQSQHRLNPGDKDSSFSDEREENFESYGENEDVEYEP